VLSNRTFNQSGGMGAESVVLPKHHRNPRKGKEKQVLQETIDAVTTELKRFAQQLNLSEPQKEQLKTYLAARHAELEKYREQHPNLSRGELVQKIGAVRGALREQVVKFLTPEQLQKWDAEVSKAKEFLGHKLQAG